MPYSSRTDILNQISAAELAQLTSEDGSVIDDAVVAKAIADADADIDSYCGRKYLVPFSPVPSKINQLSVTIALYNLFSRRASKFGGVNETIRQNYEDAVAFLKDVAKGNAVIDGAVKPPQNTKRVGGKFTGNERVFTKAAMDEL